MQNTTLNLDNATEALDTLSAEHRQSIHLSYSAGFSTEQVADLLGVPVDVAEARLEDGLTHLREALRVAA
jgi:DNA-directed RNA polymerase specialized sigma24 family protein